MAEAVVGGAFLSAFLNVIFERLSSSQFLNLIQGKKLDQELLERLKISLHAIQVVLNDAEHKEINEPAVKNWLDDLRDAVYVADDLLDRLSTKAATQKEVSNFLSIYLNLRDREMENKIKDITRQLEYFLKYKDILGLKEIARENFSWRTPSTSLLEGSNLYGRTQDKGAIIQLLLDDNSEGNISVIPIVGMGGVGKTTLAQSIYNDENLMKKFDLKAWICVSVEFDIVKVTKTAIEAITSSGCNKNDLNLLQLDLKTKLTGKKFFIVLDDIWNGDYNGWNSLKKPFQYGIKGSKILVTTRSRKVASIVQTCPPYHLDELSDTDCWSVFADHACFPRSNGDPTLEKIGRDIVKKCKGLPLAVQTLGGLLRAKRDIKDWNAVLTSEIWELSANDSKIIPALRISYYHLPPHLKRCFVYCSLFPKDYKFDKDELILLWMAEDLLEQPKQGKTLEEVGSECFDDLASRLIFKQFETDDVQYFVMHDLMHDLAISLGGDFYFRSEKLGKEKYLRVLSFCHFWELDVLPALIGELIQLRYLDLSKTGIKSLPESLVNLYNLQTLKLYRCEKLTMLPSGMQNLVNFRHLDIRGTALEEMPQGMSQLKQLQYLSFFVVDKHEENGMKELGELSNLHGSLSIRKLENVTNSREAREARIMDKSYIENLLLEWSSGADKVPTSTHIEREIFDKLQPHKDLKVLTVKSNCCMLPSLGQLPSLKSLEIVSVDFYKNDNDNCSLETPFPSLEFGKMSCWKVWHLLDCDTFPQLKQLKVYDCPNLMGDLPSHLPSLQTLEIYRCMQLVASLPRAPAICELHIHESNKVRLQEMPISLQSLSLVGDELVGSMFESGDVKLHGASPPYLPPKVHN
ncbi:P-loop containing nucleoside triphosphate hydrolase [Sesbania bispinosa]|nr:P-loop containing nucleoside triphosphate hydrolase [Sesbania bispinosa]